MVIVKKEGIAHYIEGYVTLNIRAYLTNVSEGDIISQEKALNILETKLQNLADSNTSSEMLANAKIELI